MITDARPPGDLVAAPHLESLVERLAARAQGLTTRTDMATAESIEKSDTATLRAASNIAAWRAYLSEDCVVAMVKNGWHWST
jgi:hypothetical protein